MKKLFLILFGFSLSFLSAQNNLGGESIRIGGGGYTVVNKAEGVGKTEGSPYFNDSFLPSEVIDYNQPISLRYNAHTDEMEFEIDDQLYSLKKDVYSIVYLGPSKIKYIYTDYRDGSKNVKGFLSLIGENSGVSIYKKEAVKLNAPKVANSSYEKSSPATYKKLAPEFFIQVDDQIVNLPSNKKKLAKLFGADEEKVLDIIDSNKISLDNEASLKQFVNKL